MAWRSSGSSNSELARNMHREGLIRSDIVLQSFLGTDRACFLPAQFQKQAYEDKPFRETMPVTRALFHMSAPHIYASVLEALELKPGMSFLNLGSGTGYFSYLVARIVGQRGVNHGIETQVELVDWANSRCAAFQQLSDVNFVRFRCGDVFLVDTSTPMYDRVYVGGAVDTAMLTKFRALLNVGGILVAPKDEELVAIHRCSRDTYSTRVISTVNFGPLVSSDPKLVKLLPRVRLSTAFVGEVHVANAKFGVTQARFVQM